MRLGTLVLMVALALAPALASASTVVSCTPPVTAQTVVALPCTVQGNVTTQFLVKVYSSYNDLGFVAVDAEGPAGHVYFVCPTALVVAVCGPPVYTAPPYAGRWFFTARPLMVDGFDQPYVKLEVTID